MTIKEQIEWCRNSGWDAEHWPHTELDDIADTMEKLLAVHQAAIELSNELQGWQDFELASAAGWTNTRCLENKHQLMLDAIEPLS